MRMETHAWRGANLRCKAKCLEGEPANIPQEKIIRSKGSSSMPVESEHIELKGSRSANSHTVSSCTMLCRLGVLDFIMRQFGYINIFIASGWTSLLTLQAMQMTGAPVLQESGTNVEC